MFQFVLFVDDSNVFYLHEDIDVFLKHKKY